VLDFPIHIFCLPKPAGGRILDGVPFPPAVFMGRLRCAGFGAAGFPIYESMRDEPPYIDIVCVAVDGQTLAAFPLCVSHRDASTWQGIGPLRSDNIDC
jgi:hypothetical protein